ncbi:MAG: HD-GYP domain-containing protein [Rugosibacter sp.]|nr:HD-GYP domain-containing protein [Rugosibacter sp.]
MKKKQVSVDQLAMGMYVAELDRPWLGTPFAFQGFPLTSAHQVEVIKQYCKFVMVDVDYEPPLDSNVSRAPSTRPELIRGNQDYPVKVVLEKEVPRAKTVYTACEVAVGQMMNGLRSNERLDTANVKESVSNIVESVLRNPDAMLLLTKLKTKGDYEFMRAVDTSVLMVTFGRFLQLDRIQLNILGLAGMLLDVGKINIPDSLLRKKSLLTHDEYSVAKMHALHSVDILLKEKDVPKDVIDIVRQHHERQDGSGYPEGISGEEITLFGSIAGMVDSYSAMVSNRPYTEQFSPSNALSGLYKLGGTLFHKALIEQFIQCVGIYPVGSLVELNTGEVGLVIAQNLVRRLQPRVMVILDKDWNPMRPEVLLDLMADPPATADEPYRIRRTLQANTVPVDLGNYFL